MQQSQAKHGSFICTHGYKNRREWVIYSNQKAVEAVVLEAGKSRREGAAPKPRSLFTKPSTEEFTLDN